MKSPTMQLSRRLLKANGWTVDRCERFESHPSPHRVDLFGFGDLIAFRDDEIVIVQTTTSGKLANRIAKASGLEAFHGFCRGSRAVEFHGWSKRGERGKRKLWVCRVVRFEGGARLDEELRTVSSGAYRPREPRGVLLPSQAQGMQLPAVPSEGDHDEGDCDDFVGDNY